MSTSDKICKDGASFSNDDGAKDVEGMLQKMSVVDNDVSVCANCGKEGANNICNKCNITTYCNAVCKKVHKKKHKKQCEEHIRLAAEKHNEKLRIAAELHNIELFKQSPPAEDCPICFQQLPLLNTGWKYETCCGKVICSGCVYAPVYDNQGNKVDDDKQNECPFCRFVAPKTDEEIMKRIIKRVEVNDEKAIYSLGTFYRYGIKGYPQDYIKALELFHQAAELGYTEAYLNIGYLYMFGLGVEVDKKKAIHYWELAAMMGDVIARHNLAINEARAGNVNAALKHYMIAVVGGDGDSLKRIKELFTNRDATKDDYMKALQLYQEYLGEIKSVQRDEAAAAKDEYRYY